ncbi:MAG: acyl carrier protein [Planctomycetota bacterium]|jgi:acyl carrier protein
MPQKKHSIEERISGIIIKQLNVDKKLVTPQATFINDLGADSLDTVNIIMEFEDTFNINIPDKDAKKIETVGNAIDYIEEYTRKVC